MDYLEVIALGATNCSVIKCTGIGPEVGLDSDYLDMGVVESSKFSAKSFKVVNNSDVPAAFQVKHFWIYSLYLTIIHESS